MIIVNLKGGIGNQMFQYACGRALSLRNNDELKLNVHGLETANSVGDIYRPYALDKFNIRAAIASRDESNKLEYRYGMLSKIRKIYTRKIQRQFYLGFVSNILSKKGDIYLDGYFQTEKYFADFAEIIRNDFTPKTLSQEARQYISDIESGTQSVSIHIRRGDYVGHKTLGNICTAKYYRDAISLISKRLNAPKYYIFSNDIDWVKQNMQFSSNSTYISSASLKDYEELVIMSRCANNIICNSSFSWWAAWLNPNDNKIVIAPKKWAHGHKYTRILKDLIPKSWVRI